jgi:hypothetical protein
MDVAGAICMGNSQWRKVGFQLLGVTDREIGALSCVSFGEPQVRDSCRLPILARFACE